MAQAIREFLDRRAIAAAAAWLALIPAPLLVKVDNGLRRLLDL